MSEVVAQVIMNVYREAGNAFSVKVGVKPDIDSAAVAMLLRRGADEVEAQAPGTGGPL